MPIQTDLSVSPYFDDYAQQKNYYKILFQPGVAVQARELNQLQTILQNQIERFGDNILKKGTIIQGCNVTYLERLPFVKITDTETDGAPVNVGQYAGYYVKNSANLQARIEKTAVGLESSLPDLNTLYLKYLNSGDDYNTTQFSADQVLTIYDPRNPIFKFNITDGSSGFSNADTLIVSSSLAVQNSTGGTSFAITIEPNDIITNAGVAVGQIVEVNTSYRTDAVVLKVKPTVENLKAGNSAYWTFYSGDTVEIAKGNNPTVKTTANKIANVYGYGAKGSLVTDALGKVVSISVVNRGIDYEVDPVVTISSTSATLSEINQFSAEAQRYLTKVTSAGALTNPVGFGYGLIVDEGIVYQKGYFSRVESQLVIVEKYSNTGFNKSVGFSTVESIVSSEVDTSLLDNATGTYNYTAPGADRLKLTPELIVLDKLEAEANVEFFPIVNFSEGSPYKHTKTTVYSTIGDVMAERTYEESGNYVIDSFNLNTKDSANTAKTANVFNIYVDPGLAYIKGYKVQTSNNYIAEVSKGTETFTRTDSIVVMDYGSYLKVNQVGGVFNYTAGDIVEFYSEPATYLSANAGGDITPKGTKLGQARLRNVLYEFGTAPAGTPTAEYRMYLFDITLNPGVVAGSIRSIYYPNVNTKGIADVILENGTAVIKDSRNSSMLFQSTDATKSLSNVRYSYRASALKTVVANGAILISNGVNEQFPYTSTGANLTDFEESTISIIPLVDIQKSANISGSVVASSTSANVTGTSTTFTVDLSPGDYIRIANTTSNVVAQIATISNNTFLTLTANAKSSITGNVVGYFPRNVSIPLAGNAGRTARISTTAPVGQLQIQLGTLNSSTSANVIVEYNVTRTFETQTKAPTRNAYVRLNIANNAASNSGPWALGVSDVFRMRNVYIASGAQQNLTFGTTSSVQSSNDFITILDNPFSNGDSVTYIRPTGNTAVIGLSNNTLYYVIDANTSGLKLSTTSGGVAVNVFANATSETHILSGNALFFTPSTAGVLDVTNEFYIDNNQKTDYLDISYLYRKPGLTAISNTSVLLVCFDMLTTSADGVKTINSYTLDDAKTLETINGNAIHTLEIPELFDNGTGKYYDLRDQIDIRPVSKATIPVINTTAAFTNTMIINPVEPVDGVFANATFNALSGVANTTDFISITTNPFVDGDAVLYTTAAGNTAISGLANNGTYYVVSSNTTGVKLSTSSGGSVIDLTAGVSETGHILTKTMLRFDESTKYWPIPGTAATCDIEYYMGRIDRVVLTSDGRFRTIKGVPGFFDNPPPQPVDAMTINILNIPQYPSLPFALSQSQYKIADTKVNNEKSNQRRTKYRVKTAFTQFDQSSTQIRPYRMSDIAALERRIATLEYYNAITLSETLAKSRYIPSSNDSATDRFKFGFFVDSFKSTQYSEVDHPEYNVSIEDDLLQPRTRTINLELTFDINSDGIVSEALASFPIEEYNLINQSSATVYVPPVTITQPETGTGTGGTDTGTGTGGTDTTPSTPGTTEATTTVQVPVVEQEMVSVVGQSRSGARADNESVWEDWNYTFSSLPGTARLYMNALDLNCIVRVYQSNVPGDTSGTPIAVSYNIYQKTTNFDKSINGEAYNLGKQEGLEGPKWPRGWLEDSFKMFWNYNPANGRHITVRVFKGKSSGGLFGVDSPYKGWYMFRLYYPTDKVTLTTTNITGSNIFDYVGVISNITPDTFTITRRVAFGGSGFMGIPSLLWNNASDSQRFDMTITGLRPLTAHRFFFEDENHTNKCVQPVVVSGSAAPETIVSDANGTLTFSYYYDAGLSERAISPFGELNQLAAQVAGKKSFLITNSDGSSRTSGTIDIKYDNTIILPGMTTAPQTTDTSSYAMNASDIGGGVDLKGGYLSRYLLMNAK